MFFSKASGLACLEKLLSSLKRFIHGCSLVMYCWTETCWLCFYSSIYFGWELKPRNYSWNSTKHDWVLLMSCTLVCTDIVLHIPFLVHLTPSDLCFMWKLVILDRQLTWNFLFFNMQTALSNLSSLLSPISDKDFRSEFEDLIFHSSTFTKDFF